MPDIQKTFQDINKDVLPELAKTLPNINDFADKTGKKIDDFMASADKVLPDIQKTFQSVNKVLIPKITEFADKTEKVLPDIQKTFQSLNKDSSPICGKTNDEAAGRDPQLGQGRRTGR